MSIFRRISNNLESPLAFRIVSALACIHFGVTALGKTGSYFEAISAMVMFLAIWLLGFNSVKKGASNE